MKIILASACLCLALAACVLPRSHYSQCGDVRLAGVDEDGYSHDLGRWKRCLVTHPTGCTTFTISKLRPSPSPTEKLLIENQLNDWICPRGVLRPPMMFDQRLTVIEPPGEGAGGAGWLVRMDSAPKGPK